MRSILPKPPKVKAVTNRSPSEFGHTVNLESARTGGFSRKLLGAYGGSPARFLPKSKSLTGSLKSLMGKGSKQPF